MNRPYAPEASFDIAEQKINILLKRLNKQNVCGCCTARAFAFAGAHLAEDVVGSAVSRAAG
jgi:hypothetical protein